jgi:hypothetical protein
MAGWHIQALGAGGSYHPLRPEGNSGDSRAAHSRQAERRGRRRESWFCLIGEAAEKELYREKV